MHIAYICIVWLLDSLDYKANVCNSIDFFDILTMGKIESPNSIGNPHFVSYFITAADLLHSYILF